MKSSAAKGCFVHGWLERNGYASEHKPMKTEFYVTEDRMIVAYLITVSINFDSLKFFWTDRKRNDFLTKGKNQLRPIVEKVKLVTRMRREIRQILSSIDA